MATDWNTIYQQRAADQLSWFEPTPAVALRLIADCAIPFDAPLIDVGAGAAALIDALLAAGYRNLSALDCADSALAVTQHRLGSAAAAVQWIVADILAVELPRSHYALWHDRAVFHFLTEPADQQRYLAAAAAALRPGGYLLLATFAADGPTQCSGRPVQRYSAADLAAAAAAQFTLTAQLTHRHQTPSGGTQAFTYALLQRLPSEPDSAGGAG